MKLSLILVIPIFFSCTDKENIIRKNEPYYYWQYKASKDSMINGSVEYYTYANRLFSKSNYINSKKQGWTINYDDLSTTIDSMFFLKT